MPQGPLRKVQAGERLRIPASTYNAFIDAAIAERSRQNSGGGVSIAGPGQSTTVILIRNDSGSDVGQFGILGIDEPMILPADNEDEFRVRVAMKCITPATGSSSADDHREGKFVVTAEPIASGAIGRAIIAGVTWVQIDILDENATVAEIIDGDTTKLQTSSSGAAAILWMETGSSAGWALVRFGGGGTALPVGQYRFMTLQVTAQNTWGADWQRAHPTL